MGLNGVQVNLQLMLIFTEHTWPPVPKQTKPLNY